MISGYTTKSFVEILSCAKKVIFITDFVTLCFSIFDFLFIRKQLAQEGISKIFFLDHFSLSILVQKY